LHIFKLAVEKTSASYVFDLILTGRYLKPGVYPIAARQSAGDGTPLKAVISTNKISDERCKDHCAKDADLSPLQNPD
jgi:hypothetical protein